jgi:hypothetical protein
MNLWRITIQAKPMPGTYAAPFPDEWLVKAYDPHTAIQILLKQGQLGNLYQKDAKIEVSYVGFVAYEEQPLIPLPVEILKNQSY